MKKLINNNLYFPAIVFFEKYKLLLTFIEQKKEKNLIKLTKKKKIFLKNECKKFNFKKY